MRTDVAKPGDSLAIRLPRQLADALDLGEGTAVEIEATAEGLTVRAVAPRYSCDDLLAGITDENLPDETFDDRPRGAETSDAARPGKPGVAGLRPAGVVIPRHGRIAQNLRHPP